MVKKAIATALWICAAVIALASCWWWALFGMSPQVGAAWEATIGLFFGAGVVLFISCLP